MVRPNGVVIVGPLHEAEGFICAEVDLKKLNGSRWMLDVAGHHGRPDVLQLSIQQG